MADKREAESPPPRQADFIDRIVKDPKNPPRALLLVGYLGRSSEEGYTRLYLDPELSDYVEIPTSAILHAEDSGEDSPLAGNYVWISRSAEVIHGEAGGQRYRAGFLEGRITQDYLGQAAGGAGQTAGAAFAPYTIPFPVCFPTRFPPFCPPSVPIFRCPTRYFPLCRSVVLPLCPSILQPYCRPSIPRFTCPVSFIVLCPSVAIRCPSVASPFCGQPSALTICPSVAVRCFSVPVQTCPVASAVANCPTLAGCPSAVDACPSAPGGCTIDITTVYQGTTVVNPGAAGGLAGGGFAGGYGDAGFGGADMGGYGFGG